MRASHYTLTPIISRLDAASRFRRDFWDARQPSSVKGPAHWHRCHDALHVASPKTQSTASATHTWQSVITGALYCVFTPKVVRVSDCLNEQKSSSCRPLAAHSCSFCSGHKAQLAIVQMRRNTYFISGTVGSHLFLMLHQQLFHRL